MPSYSLEEAARRIARTGYDAIEIGCAAPHRMAGASFSRRVARELKTLINGEGLVVSSLLPAPGGGPGNNPTSILPEERAATIAHYKEVVDLAHDLGAERVLYIAGWRSIRRSDLGRAWLGRSTRSSRSANTPRRKA